MFFEIGQVTGTQVEVVVSLNYDKFILMLQFITTYAKIILLIFREGVVNTAHAVGQINMMTVLVWFVLINETHG